MELSKLKQLLGIDLEDTSKDVPLNFAMDNVQEVINNYCHTAEIPAGLLNTAYRMAVDLWRNENFGESTATQGSVSSISEGDTSVSFNQTADVSYQDSLLKNYRAVLNRYRKVAW